MRGSPGPLREITLSALRAVKFVLLSGCRKNEALILQWRDVDFAARCLRLRDSKTEKRRGRSPPSLDHLSGFKPKRAQPADYVFPGEKAGQHVRKPLARMVTDR